MIAPPPAPSLSAIVERLKSARRVAIFTHQRPDPDCARIAGRGGRALRRLAQEIFVMQFTKPPAQYAFLLETLAENEVDEWSSEWAGSAGGAIDTILVVDTCTFSQLEPAIGFLKAEREKIVVLDHHLSRDDLAPLIYADTQAAACVEIIWEIARAAGVKIDKPLALPLMAGLVSDTGWFRFDSVKPPHPSHGSRSHAVDRQCASLLAASTNGDQAQSRTDAAALAGIEWSVDDRFACMKLRQSDFHETGATQSQTEYLVDLPMVVKTVEVVALLTEMPDGKIRGSLRSKRDVDVNQICRQFSGGGHAKAAGCRFEGITLSAAATALSTAIATAPK